VDVCFQSLMAISGKNTSEENSCAYNINEIFLNLSLEKILENMEPYNFDISRICLVHILKELNWQKNLKLISPEQTDENVNLFFK